MIPSSFTASTIYLLCVLLAASSASLDVRINTGNLVKRSTDGRAVVLFAPPGEDPLAGVDITGSNYNFGKNVFNVQNDSVIVLSGGSNTTLGKGVYGFPNVSLSELPLGEYNVQAFLTTYEKIIRNDGSRVNVQFPLGDGSPSVGGESAFSMHLMSHTDFGTFCNFRRWKSSV